MSRVYICHTFYHVYVALLREFYFHGDNLGEATLLLSTMSNNFTGMKERAQASGVFRDVFYFDEKEDLTSDEVMKYHQDKGNLISNMLQRIIYTRKLGQLQEPYIPVDLKGFEELYLFCDSDPIGYYLNYKKIRYHALEDGLDSCKLDDQARNTNQGAFELKCSLAKTGLIFIENGYSRYCIDYIVNDISVNPNPPKNIVECSFADMYYSLTDEQHKMIISIFLENPQNLLDTLDATRYQKPCVMILTEPLCDNETRARLFRDIVDKYKDDYTIILKIHPRDLLDYETLFSDCVIVKERFPMEVMNNMSKLRVAKLISVITQVNAIYFADTIEYLGFDFLDLYEDPAIHRKIGLEE